MTNPEIPLATRISAAIRALMAVQMKERTDLAEYLNIDRRTAKKLWSGEKEYSLDQIDALAKWLGVETRALTSGSTVDLEQMAVSA